MSLMSDVDRLLTDAFNEYVINSLDYFMAAGGDIIRPILIFYFMMLGFSFYRGAIEITLKEMMTHMFTLSVVFIIGFNQFGYMQWVYQFFMEFPNELASSLFMHHNANYLEMVTGNFDIAVIAAQSILESDGYILPYLAGGTFVIASSLFYGYLFFLFAISKMATLLLLGLGPFFFILLIFAKTARMFEAWMQQLINYALLHLLILVLLYVSNKLLALITVKMEGAEEVVMGDFAAVMLAYIFFALFATEIKTIAATISGNFHVVGTSGFNSALSSVSGSARNGLLASKQKLGNMASNYHFKAPSFGSATRTNQIRK